MTDPSFHVRRLHLRRLYGIEHALEAADLVPGVNVVYGPNGQGKTTLGRAIHGLVWPDSLRGDGPVLSGAFAFDGSEWQVRLEGQSPALERDGRPTDPPALPGLEERARYRLSLHDLLHSDGGDFAAAVARDAAGGMDVGRAARDLGFSESRPTQRIAEAKGVEAARLGLQEVVAAQNELASEQARLRGLRGQRKAAVEARGRLSALALALEHAGARDAARAAHAALEAYGGPPGDVRDDDVEALRDFRERVRRAESDVADAGRRAAEAQARLDDNAVESAGHPPNLPEIKELLAAVRESEGVLKRKEEEVAGLLRQEETALRSLGPDADPDRIAAVDAGAIGAVEAYAARVARVRALRKELEAVRKIQASVAGDHPAPDDPDRAAEAARALREWLRTAPGHPSASARPLALVGAVASALGAAALAATGYPVGLALLVPAALLAVLYVRLAPADGRATHARDRYARAWDEPVEWTPGAVEDQVERLDRAVSRAAVTAEARRYAAAWEDGLGDVGRDAAEVEAEGAAIASSLGFAPDVSGVELFYTVRRVAEAQGASGRRAAAEAALTAARAQRDGSLARAAGALAPYGLAAPTDAASLADRLDTLEAAVQGAADARREHEGAVRDRDRAEADRREAVDAIAALFERVGLDPDGGDDAVREAVRQAAPHRERTRAAAEADAVAAAALAKLRAHPGGPDLEGLDAEAVRRRTEEAERLAERADDLVAEVTAIETRVGDAQGGHDLERAGARLAAARDALREVRARTAASAVGHVLAEHAARASRESQVPAVVKRAGETLGAITDHRYTLLFDPEQSEFLARDTVLARSFRLDELSSGTRVQVLLSVRVAFVEQRERGARLPLVLDELMANSDEDRAAAIAEAVLALCRAGRQVFYLTSRPDEVAKWRRLADACDDVECAFITLGPSPREPGPDEVPAPSLTRTPPAPNGHDHGAYGAALDVPRWTGHDDPGALHLWYLLDDPGALHAALTAGVERLGPALAAVGAGAPIGLDDDQARRLRVLGDAVHAWRRAWREGRGRPVLRETLEACSAVSDRWIDEVAASNDDLGGDGEALVAFLRDGGLKGFHAKKTDELEAYLVEHGHVDPSPTLDDGAVWGWVVDRVGADCAAAGVDLADVRAALGRIATGPAAP